MTIKYWIDNTCIYNSYRIEDIDLTIRKIIIGRTVRGFKSKRSFGSYARELKAHIRMYKMHLFRSHTKDTDLEEDIKFWKEVVYFFFGW